MKPQPRYIRIAIDIAESIVSKELLPSTKISGRSTLASKYKVSPETIRKAIALLKDFEVVSSTPKKGITILNIENASLFISNMQTSNKSNDLRKDIKDLLNEKTSIDNQIKDKVDHVFELSNKPKHIASFFPYELQIPEDSHLVGTTIGESSFWHQTGSTIIMIKRDDKNIISPGPNAEFINNDTIVFVCKAENYELTKNFIIRKE
ncbi:MAG: TrkA C-terminal domain-containing protein [Bacillota bacterium]|nr:TrkA C-terminal domain-containing protein [Bacillota bacterium]